MSVMVVTACLPECSPGFIGEEATLAGIALSGLREKQIPPVSLRSGVGMTMS
jgi:hypothetical protein